MNSGSDYYYRARSYQASNGLFTSIDSFGFSANSANLYSYVRNAVLNATDPTGNISAFEAGVLTANALFTIGAGALGCLLGNRAEVFIKEGSDSRTEFVVETIVRGGIFAVFATGLPAAATAGLIAAPTPLGLAFVAFEVGVGVCTLI